MSNKFVYLGDESDNVIVNPRTGEKAGRNLGRFGVVKPGDVLTLTPKEAEGIVEDPRFEAFDETKHDQNPEHPKADESSAEVEAIRQMSDPDLRALAKELGIQIKRGTETPKVLSLVLAAKFNINAAPEE